MVLLTQNAHCVYRGSIYSCHSQRWVLVPVVKLVNRSTILFIRSLLQACHLDAKVRFIVKWLITANKVIY